MKTHNLTLALVAAMLSVTSFFGEASAFVIVVPVEVSDKTMVQVSSPAKLAASIYIFDAAGRKLVSDEITPGASTKYYDFTKLPDGVYTFESFAGQMNIAKQIEVRNSRVEILSRETEFKPFFVMDGSALKVSFLNQDMENIEFSIENNIEVFYQEEEGNDLTFNKKFNTSRMQAGEYYATLKVDGRTFYHYFRVD